MAEILAPIAERDPDRRALTDEIGQTSWGAFNERVNRLIGLLRASGLRQDDRVAVFSGNRREVYEVYVAALHSGLAVVPMSWELDAEGAAYIFDHSDAKALIVDPEHGDVAAAAIAAHDLPGASLRLAFPGGEVAGYESYEDALAAYPPDEPTEQIGGRALHYTSGTTGAPKGVNVAIFQPGVPMSHLAENARLLAQGTGIPIGGRTLLVGPIYHSGQFALSTFPLLCGGEVTTRRHPDPEVVLQTIEQEQITNTVLLPVDLGRILQLPQERRDAFDSSSLQVVLHGGAPCPPDIKRRMLDWWGPIITEFYGATEGGLFATLAPDDWRAHPTSVGRPVPFIEVMIVGDDQQPLPPPTIGRVYMRNRTGADFSYHKNASETAKAHLDSGFFTVGDLGYLDEDGFMYVVGRSSDAVAGRGGTVYPTEVEGVLCAHEAVSDAAVFGLAQEGQPDRVCAAVEALPGRDTDGLADELKLFIGAQLAAHKVPDHVYFVKQMPRTAAGKLAKGVLRDEYSEPSSAAT